MACFKPLTVYRKAGGGIVFDVNKSIGKMSKMQLACGQCIGCRLSYSQHWAIRCLHESKMHQDNCFITLTFNEQHKSQTDSLDVRDFQLFAKRLRKEIAPVEIRYFHAGEYGDQFGRPHHHACIFGYNFPDKTIVSVRKEKLVYRSPLLEKVWPFGFSSIMDFSYETAAYVARYCVKKINGPAAQEHYEVLDKTTGELIQRKPEFITMSRKPGIGKPWLDKYMTDVYPHDVVIHNGKKLRPPKYYDGQYELVSPTMLEELKLKRQAKAKEHKHDLTPERLAVREQVQLIKAKRLVRELK